MHRDNDWNKAFNFSSDLTFVTNCMKETNGTDWSFCNFVSSLFETQLINQLNPTQPYSTQLNRRSGAAGLHSSWDEVLFQQLLRATKLSQAQPQLQPHIVGLWLWARLGMQRRQPEDESPGFKDHSLAHSWLPSLLCWILLPPRPHLHDS